jgi:hypothetical protein
MYDLINADLDKFAAVAHTVEAIEAIAKWALDEDGRDADAVATIASMIDTLRGMLQGQISSQDTEEEIAALRHALIGVDHKFDGSEL